MKKSKYIFILVLGLLGWVCMDAKAGPITTFEFSGYITNIADPTNLLNGQLQLGAPFHGHFSVDLLISDTDLPDGGRGLYPNAVTSIEGQIGPFGFSGPQPGSEIEVRDGHVLDALIFKMDVDFLGESNDIFFYLSDLSGTILQDDAIPLPPIDVNSFSTAILQLGDQTEQIPLGIQGQVTSIVPEPATLLLCVTGLVIILVLSKQFRQNRSVGFCKCIFVIGISLLSLNSVPLAFGTDCNQNGVEDADEVSADGSCLVDVIFILDTSTSMGPK